jgi:hypothetical protein
MTRSTTGTSAGHRHDRHCYWDHLECGWVCGPRPAERPVAETRPAEAPEPVAAAAERPLATAR